MEEIFPFSMSEEMDCWPGCLFVASNMSKFIFAGEAKCSAWPAMTNTQSSTFKMFRGMNVRLL